MLPAVSLLAACSTGYLEVSVAVDKLLNRCLIDKDGTDWQSKFQSKGEARQMAVLKGECKGDAEEAEIQIKSELSQSDRFTVACTEH